MGKRAMELAERFKAFNEEVIRFVTDCTDENWGKASPGEQWSVGVIIRHIAASHFGALKLAKMMVAGEPLPELTAAAIDQMNAKHAEAHRHCTRDEVLGVLRESGASVARFVAGLRDEDLDRKGHIAAVGGDMTAEQVVGIIMIQSGKEHLASAKSA
jgi:hypothetical protein